MAAYKELPPDAKVWIYQSNRDLTPKETTEINKLIKKFLAGWKNGGQQLETFGKVYYHRFIVLMVDEKNEPLGNRAIETSSLFLQNICNKYGIDLFDRLIIAFRKKDQIITSEYDKIKQLVEDGIIHNKTIIFNNMVKTKEEFERDWEVPFNRSWVIETVRK